MASSSAPRPRNLDAEIQRWVLNNPSELRSLRASLHLAVTRAPGTADPGGDDTAERMLLVATELATNAIKYGLPPTIVRLCRSGQDYIIDVVDHDPATQPGEPRHSQPPSGGRGLTLARAMALDIGWYATPTNKHVWARFPAHPA